MDEEMRSRSKDFERFLRRRVARLGGLREKDAANHPAIGTGELVIVGKKTERRGTKIREIQGLGRP
jgi:hypothetical protein